MEENIDIKVERRLVGRKAYEYDRVRDVSVLEADSGFGDAGAKLDPRTGALMYDKYAETVTKSRIIREEEPIPEPEPQPQPQAQLPPEPPVRSEGIRISSDSNAMIHFKESEDVVLSGTGALKSQSTTGIVSVENLSDDDRLWDIFVKLREQTGIAELDFESINVRELEPRNKVSKDYKINLPRPSLTVQELISTDPNYPESLIIHQGQSAHVTFQLEVRNVSGIAYRDVIVRKELPKELKKLVVPERGEEIVKLEEGTLVWKLPELLPDDAKVLVFEGDLSAEDANNETTGEVEVEATGVDTITDFLITDYDAMCRNMYFIEADETDVSEQWLCNFICENTSSFEVEVLRVEVRDSL